MVQLRLEQRGSSPSKNKLVQGPNGSSTMERPNGQGTQLHGIVFQMTLGHGDWPVSFLRPAQLYRWNARLPGLALGSDGNSTG